MTSKRELILQDIQSTVSSISEVTVVRAVKEPELEMIELSSFPLLAVADGIEELVSLKGGGYRSSLSVMIYGYVSDKDNASSALNDLLSETKSALNQDITRGGYAANSEFERISINPRLKHPYSGFIAQFKIIYLE
jgi:hypothetical protein